MVCSGSDDAGVRCFRASSVQIAAQTATANSASWPFAYFAQPQRSARIRSRIYEKTKGVDFSRPSRGHAKNDCSSL
jgi:hypothetical protein